MRVYDSERKWQNCAIVLEQVAPRSYKVKSRQRYRNLKKSTRSNETAEQEIVRPGETAETAAEAHEYQSEESESKRAEKSSCASCVSCGVPKICHKSPTTSQHSYQNNIAATHLKICIVYSIYS